jgi:hypothetical protein
MARIPLPVNLIGRNITLPPSWVTATGAEGLIIAGNDGRIFIEVMSSTTAQAFTVQTGLALNNEFSIPEFSVADTNATVSNANTEYKFGPFMPTIFNQPSTQDVYIDHAISAVLQFRAWKLV